MRIGLLTSVGRTLDAFFVEMVDDWTARGHDVHCAAGTRPRADLPFDTIRGLTQAPGPSSVLVPRRIRAWAEARELDVIVTNTATASMLARLTRLPCRLVYFCHGLHWNDSWHPAQVVEHVLASRCDAVLTINSDDEAWFRRRHPDVRRLRHGVGVPDGRYPWSSLPPQPPLRLLWAGDFVERKRPLEAVRVVRHLRDAGTDVRLTMLGDGVLQEEALALAHASGVADLVTAPGRGEVEPAMREAHALLHTAEWEGLPRILLEGLVMGRRAFAFDVKGVRDVPEAVLAPDGDVAALADLVLSHRPVTAVDPGSASGFRTSGVSRELEEHLREVVG